jgi:hypothetical protein
MAFAVTNSFSSDGKGISSEVNRNFSDMVKELNALPTDGAWKGSDIFTTTHFADGSLGGQVFSNSFIFSQQPKGPSGIDPTQSDEFVPKRFVENLKRALLLPYQSTIDAGINRLIVNDSYPITEYNEVFTFGNGLLIEVGLKLCSSYEATAQVISVDLLAGFNKIIFPWGTLLKKTTAPGWGGTSTGGGSVCSVFVGARNKLSFSTSNNPQSDFYGLTYFVVGS